MIARGCWIFEGLRGCGCFSEACLLSLRGSFFSLFFLLSPPLKYCYGWFDCLLRYSNVCGPRMQQSARFVDVPPRNQTWMGSERIGSDRIGSKNGIKRAGYLVLVSFLSGLTILAVRVCCAQPGLAAIGYVRRGMGIDYTWSGWRAGAGERARDL